MNSVSVGSYMDLTLTTALQGGYLQFGTEKIGPIKEISVGSNIIGSDVVEGIWVVVSLGGDAWKNYFLSNHEQIQFVPPVKRRGR